MLQNILWLVVQQGQLKIRNKKQICNYRKDKLRYQKIGHKKGIENVEKTTDGKMQWKSGENVECKHLKSF